MTVVEWLMDSDPAIRWQVMRDLTKEPDDVVAAERAKVAIEGWGAGLLGLQEASGGWLSVDPPTRWLETPDGSAVYALSLLRAMGLDPASEQARRALKLVRDNVSHYEGNQAFFAGEVEACINGNILAIGAYFGEETDGLVDRLLSEQLDDGGWNCDAPQSQRSSFHSTICVLEGLLEHEQASGANRVTGARKRGEEYLLDRRLLRRLSSGEVIDPEWKLFSFPTGWHYDVLRGLDYMRSAGAAPDDRTAEAIDLVARSRDGAGRWLLANPNPSLDDPERARWEQLDFGMSEQPGQPSYWNTLRAMRVLNWAGR